MTRQHVATSTPDKGAACSIGGADPTGTHSPSNFRVATNSERCVNFTFWRVLSGMCPLCLDFPVSSVPRPVFLGVDVNDTLNLVVGHETGEVRSNILDNPTFPRTTRQSTPGRERP